ncbi:nucleoside 2-deoxyribosyltransferase [Pusillimonas minor]|uniref:Uncharacterized protein n=1 Tax=Pusillimonas minor TaxID=2697024 RepID=A0A842HUT5_9BURK|nr:nucleoside 2-deoxyribosyltransferase [Pusillimonas minor]MBC2771210.1 hypothetical protein [Pusillimonas minor]
MIDKRPFVFVLMPFHHDFQDIYKLGIKQTAEELGLRAERVDEQLYEEPMLERIYQQIKAADIIIADMTKQNPNVFYEVGYAHAKGKRCILLTQNASDIPFDLKQHRHIVYAGSITNLKEALVTNLQWALKQLSTERSSGLSVKCTLVSENLELNKHYAKGTVRLVIDMHNHGESVFGEIESIILYVGQGWEFAQHGQVSPQTDSDDPRFKKRHAFSPLARRLTPGGWSQIVVTGTKILGWAHRDELHETYKISGRAMIRIATAAKTYDFDKTLEIEVSDIPF